MRRVRDGCPRRPGAVRCGAVQFANANAYVTKYVPSPQTPALLPFCSAYPVPEKYDAALHDITHIKKRGLMCAVLPQSLEAFPEPRARAPSQTRLSQQRLCQGQCQWSRSQATFVSSRWFYLGLGERVAISHVLLSSSLDWCPSTSALPGRRQWCPHGPRSASQTPPTCGTRMPSRRE